MFSFHKPKIYRSIQGCCICRAKSSSSRFTDSKRYELDFGKCFQILERRSGEICNACVLLVKRWKKLPAGSNRNWHHVVDARAGPGTKSMNKIKNKAKLEEKLLKKKHKHKHKKPKLITKPPQSPGGLSDDIIDDFLSDRSSHSDYLSHSDASDNENGRPRKSRKGRKQGNPLRFSSFLDLTYWKKTEVCCGIIFKGANGEVMVDTSLLRPCRSCKQPKAGTSSSQPVAAATSTVTRQDSTQGMDDEGCDSGIGSQEVSPDASPPESEVCTPMDTQPHFSTLNLNSTAPGAIPLTAAPRTVHHTLDEMATAAAVLDLSVPKGDEDFELPASPFSPSSPPPPFPDTSSLLQPDLVMPILDQHTSRYIEMAV